METVETAALARVDKTKAVNWARNGRHLPSLGNGSGQASRMVSPLPLIKRWRRSVGLSNPTLRESRAPLRLQADTSTFYQSPKTRVVMTSPRTDGALSRASTDLLQPPVTRLYCGSGVHTFNVEFRRSGMYSPDLSVLPCVRPREF